MAMSWGFGFFWISYAKEGQQKLEASEKNRTEEMQEIFENYERDQDDLIPILQEFQEKFGPSPSKTK